MLSLADLSEPRLYNYLWYLAAPSVEKVRRLLIESASPTETGSSPRRWWEDETPTTAARLPILLPSDILNGTWTLHTRLFGDPKDPDAVGCLCLFTGARRTRRWDRTSPHGSKPHYGAYLSRYYDEPRDDPLVEIETDDINAYAIRGVPWTPGPAVDIDSWYRRDEAATIAYWWRSLLARAADADAQSEPPTTFHDLLHSGVSMPKGDISLEPRRPDDWHYASGGRILCCPDVAPVGGAVGLLSIAMSDRCPRATWPPPIPVWMHRTDLKAARLRLDLVRRFGPLCAACKTMTGAVVDHDHITGYVRGHLCIPCNNAVDSCLHPAECPAADYLNNPPAGPLRLVYPRHAGHMRGQTARAATFQRLVAALGLPPGLPEDHPALGQDQSGRRSAKSVGGA